MLRTSVKLKFAPQDMWVGLFWKWMVTGYENTFKRLDLYICILPMLPLHIRVTSSKPKFHSWGDGPSPYDLSNRRGGPFSRMKER